MDTWAKESLWPRLVFGRILGKVDDLSALDP
jgi:hypothetical protein